MTRRKGMFKWFKEFLKSNNGFVKIFQFYTIGLLWSVIVLLPFGGVALLNKAWLSLIHMQFPLLSTLIQFAISGCLVLTIASGATQTWKLLERYKRNSLPPSNDNENGRRRFVSARTEIENLLRRFDKQYKKADIRLKRVLCRLRVLFSNLKPCST